MTQTDKAKPTTNLSKRPRQKPVAEITPAEPSLTKRDRLRARLAQADGASLEQLQTEFGWQAHTVRAAISGLRKAGFDVQRGTGDQSSVYRIVASRAA